MDLKTFVSRLCMVLLAVLVLGGCAAAPVQEMSDARQAIQAARAAGAQVYSPDALSAAAALMQRAQKQLELGQYRQARQAALAAKNKALAARAAALSHKRKSDP